MGTFDDNRRTHADRLDRFRRIPFALAPPAATGLMRPRRAVPLRAGGPRPPRARLLRGLQHPGRGPGPAPAGDRVRARRHRHLRGARQHPRADRRRPRAGSARHHAEQHPRLHAARLRDVRCDEGQRLGAHAQPRHHGRRTRHPPCRPADARGHGASLRARRAGLRRHLRERAGRVAHGLFCSASPTSTTRSCSAPATSPNSRWAGAPTASATR